MAITDISVTDIATFADGHEFGDAGAYVRIKGVARGMLDPAAPSNAGHRRSRQGAGERQGPCRIRDRFRHPAPEGSALEGSGVLVYDVPNRGSKRILSLLDDIPGTERDRINDPKTRRMPGSASASGAAIRWCGRAGTRARRAPTTETRRRVSRGARRRQADRPAHPRRIPFRHPRGRQTAACAGSPTPPPRPTSRRRGSPCATAKATAAPKSRATSGNFSTTARSACCRRAAISRPYKIYELWYEATGSKVLGIGYASVRDLVSFFRYKSANRGGIPNPLALQHERNPPRDRLWRVAERAAFCGISSNSA